MKMTRILKSAVLGLTALTIFAGCSWFGPKASKEAQDAVHTAMNNSSKVKAGTYDLVLTGKVTAGKDSKAEFKELNGSMDFSGLYDIKSKVDPRFTFKLEAKGSVDGGKDQSVGGEMRLAQKNLYFSIGKLDIEGIPDLYKATIAQFMNKWWFVALPADSFAKFAAEAGDEKDMTPQQKQIKELTEKTQFFKNVIDKGADKIGASDAKKYSAELDKEALTNYLSEVAKIGGSTTFGDTKEFNKFMKDIEFKGDIWVNNSDQTLAKLEGSLVLTPSKDNENTSLNLKVTYTATNGDVKVDVPAGAELFDVAKLLGGAAAKASSALDKAAEIKAQKDAVEKELNAK